MLNANEDLFRTIRSLVDAWCDRRCLRALREVLRGYPMPSPLTDSWGELMVSLQNVRAFARDETTEEEKRILDECIVALEEMLRSR